MKEKRVKYIHSNSAQINSASVDYKLINTLKTVRTIQNSAELMQL